MHRSSAQEFLLKVLEGLEDLPPDFTRRLAEVLKNPDADRALALRRLFEDFAGD